MAKYLRRGSQGADVVELQQALNLAPTRQAALKTDGIFGPKTHTRVTEFQASSHLVPDGVVGPLTYESLKPYLEGLAEIVDNLVVPPADEQAARQRIVENARKIHAMYHWGPSFQTGPGNPRIAGVLLADPVTRLRQGGPALASIFTVAGVNAAKCLTLSVQAEKMYQRIHTATERNTIDIVSWCGIFALYVYKISGLKMSPWPLRYLQGKDKDELAVVTKPQPGDIGVVDARGSGKIRNHHFIVTDVQGSIVKSIDGNAGLLMEIIESQHSVPKVVATGGFLSPIFGKVLA
jgi:hypothetical protein